MEKVVTHQAQPATPSWVHGSLVGIDHFLRCSPNQFQQENNICLVIEEKAGPPAPNHKVAGHEPLAQNSVGEPNLAKKEGYFPTFIV